MLRGTDYLSFLYGLPKASTRGAETGQKSKGFSDPDVERSPFSSTKRLDTAIKVLQTMLGLLNNLCLRAFVRLRKQEEAKRISAFKMDKLLIRAVDEALSNAIQNGRMETTALGHLVLFHWEHVDRNSAL